ncbi:hypothetical protein L6R50_08440 [Myxococcota bacterium]|nr:hypothetical protein [Myxococcota bacterium]
MLKEQKWTMDLLRPPAGGRVRWILRDAAEERELTPIPLTDQDGRYAEWGFEASARGRGFKNGPDGLLHDPRGRLLLVVEAKRRGHHRTGAAVAQAAGYAIQLKKALGEPEPTLFSGTRPYRISDLLGGGALDAIEVVPALVMLDERGGGTHFSERAARLAEGSVRPTVSASARAWLKRVVSEVESARFHWAAADGVPPGASEVVLTLHRAALEVPAMG